MPLSLQKIPTQKPQAHSSSITHTVSALQAYLQILVTGKTGSREINKLIPQATKQKLIPFSP